MAVVERLKLKQESIYGLSAKESARCTEVAAAVFNSAVLITKLFFMLEPRLLSKTVESDITVIAG